MPHRYAGLHQNRKIQRWHVFPLQTTYHIWQHETTNTPAQRTLLHFHISPQSAFFPQPGGLVAVLRTAVTLSPPLLYRMRLTSFKSNESLRN